MQGSTFVCYLLLLALAASGAFGEVEAFVGLGREGVLLRATPSETGIAVDRVAGDGEVRWVMPNGSGVALCGMVRGDQECVMRLDLLTGRWEESALSPGLFASERRPRGGLSEDGRTAAFLVEGASGPPRIVILDVGTGATEGVIMGLGRGALSPPSWSPRGNCIAYYFGGPECMRDESYAVHMSERTGEGWRDREVAPASRPGTRSPSRGAPPGWSARSTRVTFRARYRDEERGTPPYVVGLDGSAPAPLVEFMQPPGRVEETMTWLVDYPEYSFLLVDGDTGRSARLTPAGPKSLLVARVSSKARFVAYVSDNGEAWLGRVGAESGLEKVFEGGQLADSAMEHGIVFWVTLPSTRVGLGSPGHSTGAGE